MTDRMNELQYQDVSTYLRAWYKGKKNDSPIELGSDLGLCEPRIYVAVSSKKRLRKCVWTVDWVRVVL
jgi:hypothetical protein